MDLHRPSSLDCDRNAFESDRPALSELALKAHTLEDTAGTPVEDPNEIMALLDLGAATGSDAHDRLRRIGEEHDRRSLP